ncbi:phage tail assembly chaperone [Chromobacterium violaceum]|uniref:tail fiber assembly protein n=1 Tax=Chromobacterium violaceum TaxID=536 RepID=UPI001B331892|nr:tail fiber assembly protein [Chromobacterium violaceum]MBP4049247.1 phage tail assembly chaperone [Chromobacterium violaceum]
MEEQVTEQMIAGFREAQMNELRQRRDVLLRACDWTQMPDVKLNDKQKAAWLAYRQALRDLPEKVANLDSVEWPVQPV